MRQLAVIARLGRSNVSTQLLVEVWQSQNLEVDHLFFMHFDVLAEYGFLKVIAENSTVEDFMENLLQPSALEQQVSITQAGADFLERYQQF